MSSTAEQPKRASRRRKRDAKEKSSLQLLEEAFHLLRTCPAKGLLLYYLGSIPFAAALMYFIADMSGSSHAARDAAIAALLLTVMYFWLKTFQAIFCSILWDSVNPGNNPQHSGWQKFRYLAALWLIQAFSLPALIAGVFFLVPLGWIIAALQNSTVLVFSRDFGRQPLRRLVADSLKNSHYEWAQNHGVLLILTFLSLLMWVNVVVTCVILPTFAKSFFGIDSLFTSNPEAAILNTTFLFGTAIITWLIFSPLLKAACVLRCFYATARETGDDLLSRLASAKATRELQAAREASPLPQTSRKKSATVIAPLLLLFCLQTATAQNNSVSSENRLEQAISETMEQKQYQWKISRLDPEELKAAEQTWLAQKMREFADSVERSFQQLRDWMDEMSRRQNRSTRKSGNSSSSQFAGLSNTLSIGLIIVAAALVGWLIFLLVRNYRPPPTIEPEEGLSIADIDLESEAIVASDLPEDEWMKLAREQIAQGESRLAIRALFLASLANLGDRGLLKIARFKSNRDYRRELELRARMENDLREAFEENTGLFERVWYGLHQIGEEAIQHFLANYERISAEVETEPPAAK